MQYILTILTPTLDTPTHRSLFHIPVYVYFVATEISQGYLHAHGFGTNHSLFFKFIFSLNKMEHFIIKIVWVNFCFFYFLMFLSAY